MGTIATQIVAIGPDRLIVDLYVTGKVLITALRAYKWCRKHSMKFDDLGLDAGVGDEVLKPSDGAGKKGARGEPHSSHGQHSKVSKGSTNKKADRAPKKGQKRKAHKREGHKKQKGMK